jgi:hypothetical protein
MPAAERRPGSIDADALAAAKEGLLQPMKFLKFMGIWAYVTGGLATLMILTAIIGIPLLFFGWWVRRRANRNIETIETAFAEYLKSVRVGLSVAV